MADTKTLDDFLMLPAGAELDAAVANALGDDLKARDENIPVVVGQAITELCVTLDLTEIKPLGGDEDETDREFFDRFYRHVWETRAVRPYATALEAAVAAYRRPAPPYSTDGNAMLDLLKQLDVRELVPETFCSPTIKTFGVNLVRGYGQVGRTGFGETLPLAVCRAALSALEGGVSDAVDRQ